MRHSVRRPPPLQPRRRPPPPPRSPPPPLPDVVDALFYALTDVRTRLVGRHVGRVLVLDDAPTSRAATCPPRSSSSSAAFTSATGLKKSRFPIYTKRSAPSSFCSETTADAGSVLVLRHRTWGAARHARHRRAALPRPPRREGQYRCSALHAARAPGDAIRAFDCGAPPTHHMWTIIGAVRPVATWRGSPRGSCLARSSPSHRAARRHYTRHCSTHARMSHAISSPDVPREAAGGGAGGDDPPPLLDLLELNLIPNSSSEAEDAPPAPAPPLMALLEDLPDLVAADILARLDPADFAVLAQVGCHPPHSVPVHPTPSSTLSACAHRALHRVVYRCSPRRPPHSVPALTTSSSPLARAGGAPVAAGAGGVRPPAGRQGWGSAAQALGVCRVRGALGVGQGKGEY